MAKINKNITGVVASAMKAVKETLELKDERNLDPNVIFKYIEAYLALHDILRIHRIIKDEYADLYKQYYLWGINLKDMTATGKEIVIPFKTWRIMTLISSIETLIYKVGEILNDKNKEIDPAVRRDIMTSWNNAIHILMTTSGGIPLNKP